MDIRQQSFSLKTLILSFIVFAFVLLLGATFWIRTSYVNAARYKALNEVGVELLASGNVQIDEILPGLLLKEEKGALSYILERLKSKENLSAVEFVTNPSDLSLGRCTPSSSRSYLCVNPGKNIIQTIHRAEMDGQTLGFLVKERRGGLISGIERPFLIVFLTLVIVLVGLAIWVAFFLEKFVRQPILSLEETLKPALNGTSEVNVKAMTRVSEIQNMFEEVQTLISKYQHSRTQAALGEFASHVGHDLISPITSLRMTVEGVDGISEKDRKRLDTAIEKVRKIATALRNKQKEIICSSNILENPILSSEPQKFEIINSIVKQAILDRKKLFQKRKRLSFTYKNGTPIEARIQPVEFERILSNLLNNAIEALPRGGAISVETVQDADTVYLSVSDTGKGIPKDLLPQLGTKGVTSGKKNGLGKGLYHAKTVVESWGGKFTIESKEKTGTKVSISLPRAKKETIHLSELTLPANPQIVVVDDYDGMLPVWEKVLGQFSDSITYFPSAESFEEWYTKKTNRNLSQIFLIDFNIEGSTVDGLKLIERNGISRTSILVTGQPYDEAVVTRCAELGVPILSKSEINQIAVRIIPEQINELQTVSSQEQA